MLTDEPPAATSAARPEVFGQSGTALDDLAALANAAHAAAESAGRQVVVNARDCGKARFPLLDAQEAWGRMSDLDRAAFLAGITEDAK